MDADAKMDVTLARMKEKQAMAINNDRIPNPLKERAPGCLETNNANRPEMHPSSQGRSVQASQMEKTKVVKACPSSRSARPQLPWRDRPLPLLPPEAQAQMQGSRKGKEAIRKTIESLPQENSHKGVLGQSPQFGNLGASSQNEQMLSRSSSTDASLVEMASTILNADVEGALGESDTWTNGDYRTDLGCVPRSEENGVAAGDSSDPVLASEDGNYLDYLEHPGHGTPRADSSTCVDLPLSSKLKDLEDEVLANRPSSSLASDVKSLDRLHEILKAERRRLPRMMRQPAAAISSPDVSNMRIPGGPRNTKKGESSSKDVEHKAGAPGSVQLHDDDVSKALAQHRAKPTHGIRAQEGKKAEDNAEPKVTDGEGINNAPAMGQQTTKFRLKREHRSNLTINTNLDESEAPSTSEQRSSTVNNSLRMSVFGRKDQSTSSDAVNPLSKLLSRSRRNARAQSTITDSAPQINLNPPSPGLGIADVRSFLSDETFQTGPTISTDGNRFSNLRSIGSGLTSIVDAQVIEPGYSSTARRVRRKTNQNTATALHTTNVDDGTTEGMSTFRYAGWRIRQRLKRVKICSSDLFRCIGRDPRSGSQGSNADESL